MIGLSVLFIMMIWLSISFSIIFFLTIKIKNKIKRWLLILLIFPLIFIAPLADEIIGRYQFNKLCSEKLFFSVADNARGQSVTSMGIRKSPVSNMLLRVHEESWAYKSVDSDEIVLSWNIFHSEGGWLLQWLAGPKGGPFIFDDVCLSPNWKDTVFNDAGVYVISKENINE